MASSEKSQVDRSLGALRAKARAHFSDDLERFLRFGSSTRGTNLPAWIDAESDVDHMFIFGNDTGLKPQTFIDRLKRFAKKYYSTSEIYQSHPTVVLSLNHIRFELVPAYDRFLFGLQIPAPAKDFREWLSTDPKAFNDEVVEKNRDCGFQFLPMMRLLKYWNCKNGHIYDSYGLEEWACGRSYWFCSNLRDHLFSAISALDTWDLPGYKAARVKRAQDLVQEVKELEHADRPIAAEKSVRGLIPEL